MIPVGASAVEREEWIRVLRLAVAVTVDMA